MSRNWCACIVQFNHPLKDSVFDKKHSNYETYKYKTINITVYEHFLPCELLERAEEKFIFLAK